MYCIIPSIKVNFALNITENTIFIIFKNKNYERLFDKPNPHFDRILLVELAFFYRKNQSISLLKSFINQLKFKKCNLIL